MRCGAPDSRTDYGNRHPVLYVHGEIAVPTESAVSSVSKVYVPLQATAEKMISAGIRAESS